MVYIDIKKILKEGDIKFLKKLPNFAYTLAERLIKQDEINRVLSKYSEYEGIEFFNKLIEYLNLNIEIEGLDNLPENGKCFFVGNHAYGFIDGLIITKTIGEKYGDLKFIGNEIFFLIPNLRQMLAAVNMYDKSPKEYLLALNEVYKSDIPITHFPNGFVSRIHNRKVKDKYWHKSFIAKAVSCKRNVVPVHFCGRNSNLFYFIFTFRKIFRIKAELETLLLPREFFNKRNKTIKVKIGEMIPYENFDKSKSYSDWAQQVKEQVYKL